MIFDPFLSFPLSYNNWLFFTILCVQDSRFVFRWMAACRERISQMPLDKSEKKVYTGSASKKKQREIRLCTGSSHESFFQGLYWFRRGFWSCGSHSQTPGLRTNLEIKYKRKQ